MLKVFMGWDPREIEAYRVAEFSVERRTKYPVIVEPLMLKSIEHAGILTRPVQKKDGRLWCPISQATMATEFAISRFAVPFIHKTGWALFMDPDMLMLGNVADVFRLADPKYAVMVVKHNHHPSIDRKMDGQIQTAYARKNWSSFILWNCDHPSNRNLTHEMLNTVPGIALHQFRWLDDSEIGDLPVEWNWLAGINEPINRPSEELKNIHYTMGGPWFDGCTSPYDKEWLIERDIMDARRRARFA